MDRTLLALDTATRSLLPRACCTRARVIHRFGGHSAAYSKGRLLR